jgi:predicted amidohydrolase
MSDAKGNYLRIAVTQWHAGRNLHANSRIAEEMVGNCGRQGAEVVLLPENGLFLSNNAEMRSAAIDVDSEEIGALRRAAQQARVVVVLGGFKRRGADGNIFNTALVIDDQGRVACGYDKIHLFDATVGGQSFAASSVESPGDMPLVIQIKGIKIGVTICYDLRFPELFRQLALYGAQVILVPSAFTYVTGSAHWEVLLRARAIENGAFIVASATVRDQGDADKVSTYGHALVVGPWGEVIADLGEASAAYRVLPLDMQRVCEARGSLPVLRHVRPDAYTKIPRLVVVS